MSDKWIRSIKDNPAGKVVLDPAGNRWEWERADLDETSGLLKKLQNDELAIEHTDIVHGPSSRPHGEAAQSRDAATARTTTHKKTVRDSGGGFNPYDSSGKSRKR